MRPAGTVDDLVIGTEGLMSTSTGALLSPGWKNPRTFDITYWTPAEMLLGQGQRFYAHVKVCVCGVCGVWGVGVGCGCVVWVWVWVCVCLRVSVKE